tara:strand:+ start:704 stop:967 length:264 start_codon:yes stop_codon:yes gene_type:complete
MLKYEKLLDELAQDLKSSVDKIENCDLKSTQNDYGKYLAIISTYAEGKKDFAQIIGEALRRAGGSSAGIAAALRVYGCGKISFIKVN